MPTLPTLDSLGQRPTPVSRRGIATNPGAGVVGSALEGFGKTLSTIGQGMIEKEDRFAYATAKSDLLKADITARQELANDPDHETWGPRYTAKMKTAKEAAGARIKSRSDRAMFDIDSELDVARGNAELETKANVRRVSGRLATLDEGLANAQDSYINAPDEATAAAVLNNVNEMLSASQARGDIDPVLAGNRRRDFAQTAIVQKTEALKLAGDLDGAESFFNANRDKLDAKAEISLGGSIKEAKDNRFVLVRAEEFVHTTPKKPGATVPGPAGAIPYSSLINAEGGTNKDGSFRTSPVGAVGPAQLMPGTAPEAMKLAGYSATDTRWKTDPAINKAAGEAYYNHLRQMFGNDAMAAAAYNAGPGSAAKGTGVRGAVAKAKRDGHPENWVAYLPKETQGYVGKVGGATGTQQGPEEHDLNAIYANIDAAADKEGWTPEMRESVKAQASRVVQRDETLLDRKRKDADDAAATTALGLGDKFTDISMIPDRIRKDMSPVRLAQYTAQAKENKDRAFATANADPPPNGPDQIRMNQLRFNDPGAFMGADLNGLVGKVSRAELDTMASQQAEMRKGSKEWTPLPGIGSAYTRGEAMNGMTGDKKLKPDQEVAVKQTMEDEAKLLFAAHKGAPLTDLDYDMLYKSAVRNTSFTRSGWFSSEKKQQPRYDLTIGMISDANKATVARALRAEGVEPTDANILRYYRSDPLMGAQ